MKKRIKWTMIPTLIGAINTSLIAFGAYHFTNDQLQSVNLVFSVALAIIGVAVNNHEEKTST